MNIKKKTVELEKKCREFDFDFEFDFVFIVVNICLVDLLIYVRTIFHFVFCKV